MSTGGGAMASAAEVQGESAGGEAGEEQTLDGRRRAGVIQQEEARQGRRAGRRGIAAEQVACVVVLRGPGRGRGEEVRQEEYEPHTPSLLGRTRAPR